MDPPPCLHHVRAETIEAVAVGWNVEIGVMTVQHSGQPQVLVAESLVHPPSHLMAQILKLAISIAHFWAASGYQNRRTSN